MLELLDVGNCLRHLFFQLPPLIIQPVDDPHHTFSSIGYWVMFLPWWPRVES